MDSLCDTLCDTLFVYQVPNLLLQSRTSYLAIDDNFCRVVPLTLLSTINFCRAVPRTSLSTTWGQEVDSGDGSGNSTPPPPPVHPLSRSFFDPRYRPPTPVLVDSEGRGTTLQKLIVDSEVRGYDSTKVNRRQRRYGVYDSSKLSSIAEVRSVRLFKVNRRQRGTRYDSSKLIVDSEVRGTTLQS